MAPGLRRSGGGAGLRTASTCSPPTWALPSSSPGLMSLRGQTEVCPQAPKDEAPKTLSEEGSALGPTLLTGPGASEQEGLLDPGRPSPAGSAGTSAPP